MARISPFSRQSSAKERSSLSMSIRPSDNWKLLGAAVMTDSILGPRTRTMTSL
ncbi:hypothetical protein [Streptomyces sp. NPDC048644]|uniref:hypothetical protein n=1 Tax=Streptomyces sp. NPDC048644 TaxID=3365582 RepID=UPI0037101D24